MDTDAPSIGQLARLKKDLRDDMARFSTPFYALMDRYDPRHADRLNRSTYTGFQHDIGHLGKAMAVAFSRVDTAMKDEPTITEAEIIQETLRKYVNFGNATIDVAQRYGVARREIEPLLAVIADSVGHCKAALEQVGGPRRRRTFKFELQEKLGSKDLLIARLESLAGRDKGDPNAQQALLDEQVKPAIDKLYTLPGLVASGKLDYADAAKLAGRIKTSFAGLLTGRGASMQSPLTPVMTKLDATLDLCSRYAREDDKPRGAAR